MSDLLHISSSPHVRSKVSTSGIMGTVDLPPRCCRQLYLVSIISGLTRFC